MAAETIIDFLQEARQSLEEVAYAIREGKMSNTLLCDSSCVHLNLTTLEGLRFCVRLSLRGFEVHLFLSRSQFISGHTHTPPPTQHHPSQHTQPQLTHTFQVSPFSINTASSLCCGLLACKTTPPCIPHSHPNHSRLLGGSMTV